MTQCSEKSNVTPTPTGVVSPPKKKHVQEKIMVMLTVIFVGGVVLYAVLPEGPVRSMSICLFALLMTYLLFRFGV